MKARSSRVSTIRIHAPASPSPNSRSAVKPSSPTAKSPACVAFDGFTTSTINWQTFSQVAFAFTVSPQLLTTAVIWSAFIGLLGGLFPALHAAPIPIAAALRET